MSEGTTLHPIDPELLRRYVAAVGGALPAEALVVATRDPAWCGTLLARAARGYDGALRGEERGANAVSLGLAQLLATAHPTFFLPGAGFSFWEARIDRGLGMLLRPPSRLFGEAGLETAAARAMPIRVDASGGAMGGAFVPARLVPQLRAQLDERETRLLRRLAEAEMDAVPLYGLLLEAVAYADERGLGLYEAIDAIVPEAPEADPPGAWIVAPDRKRLDPCRAEAAGGSGQTAEAAGAAGAAAQASG
jgi:hypothetical protein